MILEFLHVVPDYEDVLFRGYSVELKLVEYNVHVHIILVVS